MTTSHSLAVVLNIPHASTVVPEDLRDHYIISDQRLWTELLRLTDWFTDSLFDLPEWHDSFVYDLVRKTFESKNAFTSHDICQGEIFDHPFVNSILGKYMDHMKGDDRKAAGSSFAGDVEGDAAAAYWKNVPRVEET